MKKFQPLKYLKKHTTLLILFFVVLTLGLFAALTMMQSYTASTGIEYVYADADQGKAPDGTDFDKSEVYTSSIVSRAMNKLGLDFSEYPLDEVRSNITVEEVWEESVSTVNEALWEQGEESELQSTK